MSYSAPPPSRKSTYEDELVDDNYSPKTSSSTPPQAAQPSNFGQQNQTTNTNLASAQNQAPMTGFAPITQEDMMFIRSWQHDSYIKRVLPFTAISFGAYYLYNKSKQLPQKISRYIGISVLCYVVGRFSYQGELKRRLTESRLDTPYIQGLRKGLRVSAINSEFSSGSGFNEYGTSQQSSPNWNSTNYGNEENVDINAPMSSRLRQTYEQPINAAESSFGNSFSNENISSEAPKPTSYEELRARNRGMVK